MTSSTELDFINPSNHTESNNNASSESYCQNYHEPKVQVVSQLNIENSEDVYFGDKNIYQGPVKVEKIIYNNGQSHKIEEKGFGTVGQRTNNLDLNNRSSTYQKECEYELDGGKQTSNFEEHKIEANTQNSNKNLCTTLYHRIKNNPVKSSIIVSLIVILLVAIIALISYVGLARDIDIHIISRLEWGAQPPYNDTTPLITPVPYVIMHHTASESCSVFSECIQHVRFIQNFHQQSRKFYDIAYNFLIAGDGNVYMGRGWTVEGAHAFGYNARSIGIAVIGTYTKMKPPEHVINTCKKLIEMGVQLNYIKKDYKLLAARQLSATESPGVEFFNDIKTWPHWVKEPQSDARIDN